MTRAKGVKNAQERIEKAQGTAPRARPPACRCAFPERTYDPRRKDFRLWHFDSEGSAAVAGGHGGKDSQTMTWQVELGNGVTRLASPAQTPSHGSWLRRATVTRCSWTRRRS
jgi:hypothetical protein